MPDEHGFDLPPDPFDAAPERRRTLPILIVVLGVLLGAGVATMIALNSGGAGQPVVAAGPSTAETTDTPAPAAPTPPGQRPGTVRLPGGGTAKLVRRELDPDGTLPIPTSLDEATWWGAGLGAPHGAALLSGHINWKGQSGPFKELWQDRTGQQIEILDTAGKRWVYQVSQALTIPKEQLPARANELFGQGGPHRLVLVTCGGEFVGGDEGYNDNRVLVANLITRP